MREIMKMMFKDIKYLNSRNLMDYSLLLIIENNPEYELYVAQNKLSLSEKKRSLLADLKAAKEAPVSIEEHLKHDFVVVHERRDAQIEQRKQIHS